MKVTPLDIRQKTFEKVLRGYDKDEVTAFLLSLSQEWERVQDETKEMRIKLEATEREVTKLREVESSLYKTLKTAEDTGANVIEQANKAAELHLKEVQLKAEALLNEAKTKAKDTIEQSEATSRQMVDEMEERLKTLVQNYKSIESERANLLGDLKRLAGETMDKVERLRNATSNFDPDQHLQLAKREAKQTLNPNAVNTIPPLPQHEKTENAEANNEEAAVPKHQKSFFDEIQ
ncbi:MAG TPA: cell division protein DivIVA [Cytophagales bacterium]|nr:cell division protein DivIVA [Cytophagales bacterium]HCR53332.1 cell division protein DivIVA [Cytophagales bacterium]